MILLMRTFVVCVILFTSWHAFAMKRSEAEMEEGNKTSYLKLSYIKKMDMTKRPLAVEYDRSVVEKCEKLFIDGGQADCLFTRDFFLDYVDKINQRPHSSIGYTIFQRDKSVLPIASIVRGVERQFEPLEIMVLLKRISKKTHALFAPRYNKKVYEIAYSLCRRCMQGDRCTLQPVGIREVVPTTQEKILDILYPFHNSLLQERNEENCVDCDIVARICVLCDTLYIDNPLLSPVFKISSAVSKGMDNSWMSLEDTGLWAYFQLLSEKLKNPLLLYQQNIAGGGASSNINNQIINVNNKMAIVKKTIVAVESMEGVRVVEWPQQAIQCVPLEITTETEATKLV